MGTSERFRLEQELVTALEKYQRSIGYELHDNLGQQIAAIAYQAKALEKNRSLLDHPEAVAIAASIARQAQNAVVHCKQMSQGFLAFELDANGLEGALREFVTRISSTYEIQCDFVGNTSNHLVDPDTTLHLYRIAQEATHNAIRHGCATHLTLSLIIAKDMLSLSIEDNGCGVTDSKAESLDRSGMGMKIMQYRARQLGASLKFLAGATGGMQVRIEMKLPHHVA